MPEPRGKKAPGRVNETPQAGQQARARDRRRKRHKEGPAFDTRTAGYYLMARRLAIGLSRVELAQLAGVTRHTIRKVELSSTAGTIETYARMARALGLRLADVAHWGTEHPRVKEVDFEAAQEA